MLASLHAATGLPIAIVRPSFVTSVARQPYPGYVGNWAGPLGIGAALAVGMVPAQGIISAEPHNVWDAIPGDLVASIIIATGAAVAAGVAPALTAASEAAHSASLAAGGSAAAGGVGSPAPIMVKACAPPQGSAPAAEARSGVMVVHACTTTTYPISMIEAWNTAIEFIRAHPAPMRCVALGVAVCFLLVVPPSHARSRWCLQPVPPLAPQPL